MSISSRGRIAKRLIRRAVEKSPCDAFTTLPPKKSEKPFKAPRGYKLTSVPLNDCHIEILERAHGKNADKVIFNVHGGGYVSGLDNSRRKCGVFHSKCACGATVVMLDYRTAPAAVYPAALSDAVSAWDCILRRGYKPENILVQGDSAGGNLALALCQYLRDNERPLPRALYLVSPWTDLSGSLPSYRENAEKDVLFFKSLRQNNGLPRPPYVGNADLRDPYLSPAFGEYRGFPKTLIQVGTDEALYSDSEIIRDKMKDSGVPCKMTVYDGMFHAFQFGYNLLPESKQAWREFSAFAKLALELK